LQNSGLRRTVGLLYAIVVASYFINSFSQVPLLFTSAAHASLGHPDFHAVFLLFGFANARAGRDLCDPAAAGTCLRHHLGPVDASRRTN